MATIKKLTLKLKSGLLSELHSDTVMGHFCWRLKDKFGEERLQEFISCYQEENVLPPFTISNGLFEKDYWDEKKNIAATKLFFPKPLIHLKKTDVHKNSISKKQKIIDFLFNKEMKSVELLTTEQFQLFIDGKYNELYESLTNDPYARPKFETDLRVSVEIDRNSFTAKEGQLFSYYPKFLDDDTRIVFLLKVLNEETYNSFHCEEILKDVFEIGFGKKKSSGYGHFEIVDDITEFNQLKEPENSSAFICLGNYVPASDDYIISESTYDFIVKYGRLGEEKSLSKNPFKKPLIMFTPGSIFRTSKSKEFYGKIIQPGYISEYDIEAVHFGTALTINLKLES